MRLAIRLLVAVALPGLVFSWIIGAVRSYYLPTCGESQLLSLLERPSACTLSPYEVALIGCILAASTVVTLLVVRVIAPSFASIRPSQRLRSQR